MPSDAARPSVSGQEPARGRRIRAFLLPLIVMLCAGAILVLPMLCGRPANASEVARALPGAPPTSAWPATGQAAIAVADGGEHASPGQGPVPTASTAKVMTAYVFLSRYPLRPGQAGPSFSVSADEAARYTARLAASESVVPLRPGQRLTEREALQALLTASANNVADELARWYGSDPVAFVAEMNRTAHQLGMDATYYTDPSGLHDTTVSTGADQVRLFQAALRLPEFATLAGSSYTDIDGHRHANTNPMLGRDGVFAGKTGTTRAAGHNLVFAARRDSTGGSRIIIGAVLHQPDTASLNTAVRRLIADSLVTAPIVRKGEVLAWAHDGWGRSIALSAEHDLSVTGPPGSSAILAIEPGTALHNGAPAGTTPARAVVTSLRPTSARHTKGASDASTPGEKTGPGVSVALQTEAPLPRVPPLMWLPLRPLTWLAEAVAP
ncbi:D-alanyl-D-alanine carboxypeptidase family protein [Streptomyces vinaceus]|uniref:D-alanyl-D-alanine carboxypeptidase family protein n=1 Tax=Streptomyces vinaceus TaxID=1960 RepID=UPI0035D987D8